MPDSVSARLVDGSKPRLDRADESYLATSQQTVLSRPRRAHKGKPRRPALVVTPTSSFVIALNSREF